MSETCPTCKSNNPDYRINRIIGRRMTPCSDPFHDRPACQPQDQPDDEKHCACADHDVTAPCPVHSVKFCPECEAIAAADDRCQPDCTTQALPFAQPDADLERVADLCPAEEHDDQKPSPPRSAPPGRAEAMAERERVKARLAAADALAEACVVERDGNIGCALCEANMDDDGPDWEHHDGCEVAAYRAAKEGE